MLDSVNADAGKLEAVAKRFDSLEAETKMLQETAEPLIARHHGACFLGRNS